MRFSLQAFRFEKLRGQKLLCVLEHMSGRGRKRRVLSDISAVTAHGAGWRARFCIDERNICKAKHWENQYTNLRNAQNTTASCIFSEGAAFGSAAHETWLCQTGVSRTVWHQRSASLWSRLILAGVKAVEVRKYPLGRYYRGLNNRVLGPIIL